MLDVTSYLIDHLTVVLIIVAVIVGGLFALWMLILFALSLHRYPHE